MLPLAPSRLIDHAGRPVVIAPKPFAVGGEGAVFDVVGDASLVAKIYNAPQPRDRSEKLRAMAGLAVSDLLKIAAWPTATLHETAGGPVTGILMPKIAGCKEIHHLYSVAQRKKDYPDADWRFLAHAARNCAIAFEMIHKHGHVIGDVNQKNVLVSTQAIVKFVDCDSFQIRTANGVIYRCAVGVPEYTPPELQGKSFRNVDRDANHDLFGLAVLIFHLLMMGRHPFSGVYLDTGDMPLEKAIQGGRFAYSRNIQATRMKPPPNTVPMAMLNQPLANLFERAFSPLGKGGLQARPTAGEWKQALDAFITQMGPCEIDPKHIYPKQAGACPWCQLLGSVGLMFFMPGTPASSAQDIGFDLLAVWGEIERARPLVLAYSRPGSTRLPPKAAPVPPTIPPPTPRPKLHPLPAVPGRVDTFLDWMSGIGTILGFFLLYIAPPVGVICLVGFGLWLVYLAFSIPMRKSTQLRLHEGEKQHVSQMNEQLKRGWESENADWHQEYRRRKARRIDLDGRITTLESAIAEASRTAGGLFENFRKNLETSKSAYDTTKAHYAKDLTEWTKKSSQLQLEHHLDSFIIRDAKIKGITISRILSLSSFGIETALDVEKLKRIKVPGVGEVSAARLFVWRDSLKASFTSKPGLPAAEKAIFEQRHVPKLRQMEGILRAGPAQLRQIVHLYESKRNEICSKIQSLVDQLAQARCDAELMESVIVKREMEKLGL
jgi:DNA-binding helix-hairpin-helix protein with protein kinase domain